MGKTTRRKHTALNSAVCLRLVVFPICVQSYEFFLFDLCTGPKNRGYYSSLPKEGDQKLQKLLGKLGIARQWQGIYTESQRHYLDDRYKNEVSIDWINNEIWQTN